MVDEDEVKELVRRLILAIGEDPTRSGLVGTPDRVAKSFSFLLDGYAKSPDEIMTTFNSDGYNQIVLLRDIEFYSMCEHHMLPFFGKAHVAYIPAGEKVIGISKLARLVDIYSKRLQIQERIGEQVTSALVKNLAPRGAACIIEACHLCMLSRGVQKQNSVMVTSSLRGIFLEDSKARMELMELIKWK